MIFTYIFFLLVGIGLTVAGWRITFTKKGLEWMYKNNIWKKNDGIFDRVSGEIFDRIRASSLFMFGIIFTIFMLLGIWKDLFNGRGVEAVNQDVFVRAIWIIIVIAFAISILFLCINKWSGKKDSRGNGDSH